MKNSGFSGKSKGSAFNKSQCQTESEVLFNPLLLIHAKTLCNSKKHHEKIEILNKISNFDIMDLSLQNKKIELIQWLSTLNDQSLIDKLMKLREKEKTDWWNEISVAEKKSIERGIQDADNGKLTSHSNVKKIYEKWI